MKTRWLGATGRRVPAVVVAGDVALPEGTLVLGDVADEAALRAAFDEGRPVVVEAASADDVRAALARPEVSCVVVSVDRSDLLDLDLRALTYG